MRDDLSFYKAVYEEETNDLKAEVKQLNAQLAQAKAKPAASKAPAKTKASPTVKKTSLNSKYQFYESGCKYIGFTPHGTATIILHFSGGDSIYHRTDLITGGMYEFKATDGNKVYTDHYYPNGVTALKYGKQSFLKR
ncbi:MAG: hypothetical protein ACRCYJ_07795 [Plesiomonas shigelloides]